MNNPSDFSALWDDWIDAQENEPTVSTESFLMRHPTLDQEIKEMFQAALTLQGSGLESLVEVMNGVLPPGFQLGGYRLIRKLGEGASGLVFEAEPEDGTGGPVALKVLNPLASATREWRDAILREAKIASSLHHSSIVRVIASGMDRGYAWVAMQRIDGETLATSLVRPRNAQERVRFAVSLGIDLCDALHHAHERGVVHRDLKPSNVLVDLNQRPYVLDFGLAYHRLRSSLAGGDEKGIGTMTYMAPEQARGERPTPSADQYSLGVMLLEVATGASIPGTPVERPSLDDIAQGRFRPFRDRLRTLPGGLRQVLGRSLEADSRDRYSSLEELRKDLVRIEEGELPRSRRPTFLQRRINTLTRRPLRYALLVTMILIPSWVAVAVWRTRPELVHFNSFPDGQQLWIDGEFVGITPSTASLAPGLHRYRIDYADSDSVYSVADGTFEVVRGETAFIFPTIRTPRRVPSLRVNAKTLPLADHVQLWFCIAARHEDVRFYPEDVIIRINGKEFKPSTPSSSIQIEVRREHLVEIVCEGFHSVSQTVVVKPSSNQRVYVMAHELESLESKWHTDLIYCPLDFSLVGNLDSTNLRLCTEFVDFVDLEPHTAVYKLFLSPKSSNTLGYARFHRPLASPVTEAIELEWTPDQVNFTDNGYSEIYLGPSFDDLKCVAWRRGNGRTTDDPNDYGRMKASELFEHMKGATSLYFEVRCCGEVGDLIGCSSVLRSSGMACLQSDGSLIWQPAIRIRYR